MSEQARRWGYVVLRDEITDSSHHAWEKFLQVMDDHMYSGLAWTKGGSAIIPTRHLIFQDGFVAASDPRLCASSCNSSSLGHLLLIPK
jgi:hypothetical protein